MSLKETNNKEDKLVPGMLTFTELLRILEMKNKTLFHT